MVHLGHVGVMDAVPIDAVLLELAHDLEDVAVLDVVVVDAVAPDLIGA